MRRSDVVRVYRMLHQERFVQTFSKRISFLKNSMDQKDQIFFIRFFALSAFRKNDVLHILSILTKHKIFQTLRAKNPYTSTRYNGIHGRFDLKKYRRTLRRDNFRYGYRIYLAHSNSP